MKSHSIAPKTVSLIVLTSALFLLVACRSETTPEPSSDAATAVIGELHGQVLVRMSEQDDFAPAALDQNLQIGAEIQTGGDGFVRLDLPSGTIARAAPASTFMLQVMEARPQGFFIRLQLRGGELWTILTQGELHVETPSGLATVRGSFMHVAVDPGTGAAAVDCLEGNCAFNNNADAVPLVAGQNAFAGDANSAPQRGRMSAADVQQWIQINPEANQAIPGLTETARALDLSDTPAASQTPTATVLPTSTLTPTATTTATSCPPLPQGWVTLTVQQGDTMDNLAETYGITVRELALGNCFPTTKQLTPGEIIFVPSTLAATKTFTPTSQTCGAPADWITYSVETGDTLIDLADATGVSVADIQYANCLGNKTDIRVGQKLRLPAFPEETTPVVSYTPPVVSDTPTPTPTKTNTPKPTRTATP